MFNNFRQNEFMRVMTLLKSRFWFYMVAVLVNGVILGFNFNMVMAFIKKDVLDAAIAGEQTLLSQAITLAAITFFVGVPLIIWARYAIASTGKITMTGVRERFFKHITNLPISSFDRQHSGDLVSRSTNDLNLVENIFTRMVSTLIFGFILGFVGIISILILEWRLGLLALTLGLITTFTSTKWAEPLRERSNSIQASVGQTTERLTDILLGLSVAKMFHIEKATHQLYKKANDKLTKTIVERAGIQSLFDTTEYIIEWFRSIGTLVFGLFLLTQGSVGLGIIVAAVHLQGNASFLFSNLGNFVTAIQKYMAGSARVFEILDRPVEPEQFALSDNQIEEPLNGRIIEMHDITFSYNDGNADNKEFKGSNVTKHQDLGQILKGIDISVSRGKMAALVGPSGGGKSTIIKLIMGFFPVRAGQLIINGKQVAQYPLTQLRGMMAYVPQDAYLFDGSIEENISYGRPDGTKEEIIASANAAQAHDFIMGFSDGYDTLVGERGAYLSGGQRQRIAIARAMLKDAPILLLDEATSALDSESEQLVQRALEVLMKGRTTIAIAHRFSTIQQADMIYVIDNGRIAEQGVHNDLISRNGLYKNLYKLQYES